MKLAEKPFISVQGEGNTQGCKALFIRFPHCNLSCRECDSSFTWKNIEMEEYSDGDIYDKVRCSHRIIFTGGEPCLPANMRHIKNIIEIFPHKQYEIETNGTLSIDDGFLNEKNRNLYQNPNIQFNISPKTNFEQERKNISTEPILIEHLNHFNVLYENRGESFRFKFIVKCLFDCEQDLKLIEDIQYKYDVPNSSLWVQPKATMAIDVVKIICDHFDAIIARGWNISMRCHVLLFDNKKGV